MTENETPAEKRKRIIGEKTAEYIKKVVDEAPPLTEEQKDTIRAAFRRPG